MKALTICQPYAQLIALPDDDRRAKRVENRSWPARYRGSLLIHAGKSRDYLILDEGDPDDLHLDQYGCRFADLAWGAVVATARLVECFRVEDRFAATRRRPWLATHEHVEGPWCWLLSEVRRLPDPIPWRGAQGLWAPPLELVASVQAQMEEVTQ